MNEFDCRRFCLGPSFVTRFGNSQPIRTQIVQLTKQVVNRRSVERRTPLVDVSNLRRRGPPIEDHDLGHPPEEVAEPAKNPEPNRLVVGRSHVCLGIGQQRIRQIVFGLPLFDLLDWLRYDGDDLGRAVAELLRDDPVSDRRRRYRGRSNQLRLACHQAR